MARIDVDGFPISLALRPVLFLFVLFFKAQLWFGFDKAWNANYFELRHKQLPID